MERKLKRLWKRNSMLSTFDYDMSFPYPSSTDKVQQLVELVSYLGTPRIQVMLCLYGKNRYQHISTKKFGFAQISDRSLRTVITTIRISQEALGEGSVVGIGRGGTEGNNGPLYGALQYLSQENHIDFLEKESLLSVRVTKSYFRWPIRTDLGRWSCPRAWTMRPPRSCARSCRLVPRPRRCRRHCGTFRCASLPKNRSYA